MNEESDYPVAEGATKTFDCPEWPMCKETGKCADGIVSHDCIGLEAIRAKGGASMNDFHFIAGYITGALDRRGHHKTWRFMSRLAKIAGIRSGDYLDGCDCGYDTYRATIMEEGDA